MKLKKTFSCTTSFLSSSDVAEREKLKDFAKLHDGYQEVRSDSYTECIDIHRLFFINGKLENTIFVKCKSKIPLDQFEQEINTK